MNETVLVVDDEPRIRRIVEMGLGDRGYRVLTATSAEEAERIFAAERIEAVVTDLQLPGRTGLELLAWVRERNPGVPVILITAFGTVETAVEALKAGAFDYVLKPFGMEEMEALVGRALDARGGAPPAPAPEADGIVAASAGMQRVLALVRQVAPAPTTVLVTGETGVGKEVVARAVHRASPRRDRSFVAVNCAAIPSELLEAELFGVARGAYTGAVKDRPGKLEVADGGTLFLDEIGDMPSTLQPKLLRVLQEGSVERLGSNQPRSVDVRIVAATHQDLAQRVRDGTFREDLYYRINVFPIHVPPLRERPEDIAALAPRAVEAFAARIGARHATLAPDVLARLQGYRWPGNVRELLNVLERAVLLTGEGRIEHVELPEDAGTQPGEPGDGRVEPLTDAVARAERAAIEAALARTRDNKAQAARLLGISVRTLFYKLEKLGLKQP
ncbi:MAG: sigma-54 dependent transcriptional regulator [Gemmatimonadota bacterium]|nr:sigma-54-dependent Fis family transcriptional regulator [Gemmatimonadota bacterium]